MHSGSSLLSILERYVCVYFYVYSEYANMCIVIHFLRNIRNWNCIRNWNWNLNIDLDFDYIRRRVIHSLNG